MTVLGLALLAGVLSALSPCVLPLLPLVLGAAASEHRYGPLALASGLAISFVAVGLFVATIGFSIGLDGDVFRSAAAILMIALGFVLVVPNFQARLAVAAGPVANWAENRFGGSPKPDLQGQFGLGLLLGAVWSPCVGPTLGAASLLASQGKDLPQVALAMLMFGVGAATPLIAMGMLSREVLMRIRERLMAAGKGGKVALGVLMVLIGVSIVTGADRHFEATLVDVSPQWLTDLTTQF